MRPFLYLLALSLLTITVKGQSVTTRLDRYSTALARNNGFNGNILVAEKGKTIFKGSYGYADMEAGKVNTPQTRFETASISKTFTATAVLQLAEQGKINLDSTYTGYFPQFPYRQVTVGQLLSHLSGLSDQELGPVIGAYEKKLGRVMVNADLISALAAARVELKLKPGEKWWYSNTGYQLLALLVEQRSGETFGAYLEKHIWQPSGMKDTYLKTALLHNQKDPQLAYNYDYLHDYDQSKTRLEGERGYFTNGLFGHSNIISTLDDFFKFDRALRNGRLLKDATLLAAYQPAIRKDGMPNDVWLDMGGMGKAEDGLGWFSFKDTSMGHIVWHTGGMPGCATIFLRNLDKDQMVIVLDNTNSEKLYRKGLSAMRILNGKPPLSIKRSLTKAYAKILYNKGEAQASTFMKDHVKDTANYVLVENDMNNLGYEFMEHKHLKSALTVFELNIRLFPESDNTYSSYGDGLATAGDYKQAAEMYRKALALNPGNEDAQKALADVTKKLQQ